ncbi:DNA internalization-related competence protein ComEC/Rec2 [Dolosigranulum savutiense]|uniref:DNA internalization-related competence protein ComEC/Rec2 n=1 Tax=Dolosigranulum savutiense TaxID=3110288 RepID=A0AB74TRX5_9LACT
MSQKGIYLGMMALLVTIMWLTNVHLIAILLLIYWIVRIVILGDRAVIVGATIIAGLMSIRIYLMPQESAIWPVNQIEPINEQTMQREMFIKPTTVQIDGDRMRFEAVDRVTGESVIGRYQLKTLAEKEAFQQQPFKRPFLLEGHLERPAEHRNRHQFNYRQYLARQGIYYTFEVVELVPSRRAKPPLAVRIDRWRQSLFDYIDHIMTEKAANYTQTLLFAKKHALPNESIDSYRSTGMIHLISISGLHIQLLITAVSYVLLRLHVTKETTAKILLGILPLYGIMAGMGVSIFRAVMQSAIYFILTSMNKRSYPLDNWSLALILLLFWRPFSIFSIGFQLSYLLSGMLIVLAHNRRLQNLPHYVQPFILSFFVSLLSLPIITYHYFEFPLISIVLNTLFVPFFSVILFPAVVINFVVSIIIPHIFTGTLLSYLLTMTEQFLWAVSDLPFARLIIGRLPLHSMIGLVIGLIGLFMSLEKKHVSKRLMVVSSMLSLISLFSVRYGPLGQVMMIDVGQGDSLVIKQPFSSAGIMVDTGGKISWHQPEAWRERQQTYTIGKDTLVPTLTAMGITHLERLYITHPDLDHMGEIRELADHFDVREIAGTIHTFRDETYRSLMQGKEMPHTILEAPQEVRHGKLSLALLQPMEQFDSDNENSLVLYGEMGGKKWLLTGDIEQAAEQSMIAHYPNLPIDILKVAHHGSPSSSSEAFLQQYQPTIGLISAGVNNQFNHPHPDVLDRLTDYAIEIYRTDQQGGVWYTYSSNDWLNQQLAGFHTVKDE